MIHSYLVQWFQSQVWAILPDKFTALADVVARHVAGEDTPPEQVAAIVAARQPRAQTGGAVALINIMGTIIPHGDMLAESSGAVSADSLSSQFAAAMASPAVSAVVFNIDSPGGSVYGIEELASQIYNARGQKPIIAVANHMAASAAYYIASAAKEIVVTPSAEVGSIGVFSAHQDYSAWLEQAGIKTTFIKAGKYKTEGNPYEPLSADASAAIQSRVNDYYNMFVKAVSRGRGVTQSDVRDGMGEGRMVGAQDAVKQGMADRIDTLDNVVGGLMPGGGRGMKAVAWPSTEPTQEMKDDWAVGAAMVSDYMEKFVKDTTEQPHDEANDTDMRQRRLRLAAMHKRS